MNAYTLAKERYAALGVDTEAVLETLKNVTVSVHCWQGDDVVALPAVDGDGHVFQCFQHGFGIDAERGVAFLCKCISVHSCSSLN